jgi:ABC-type cobalamin/Fe3+-siderophores transport system ATPase subunit
VSTLLKIMVDTNTPASTRVRAADSVLDHATKAIEIEDVEVRVAALEQAAELSKQGR